MLARVIEILGDRYKVSMVDTSQNVFVKSRGKVKKDKFIKVGDLVNVSKVNEEYVIESITTRKNDYIRPPVANIDYMFVVVAAGSPKPDFLLLDKQIITTEYNKCQPIIVVNKSDLKNADDVINYVSDVYSKAGYKVIITNTLEETLVNEDIFKDFPAGTLCAFSGNSGVGKSSIISKLKEDDKELDINSISEKTGKGRHTTKSVNVYTISNNDNKKIYFLDTPGFSSFELYNISSNNLKEYYNEFNHFKCEYDDCNHVNEDIKSCRIKQAVKEGYIDKLRYENYCRIYEDIKQKEKNLYK